MKTFFAIEKSNYDPTAGRSTWLYVNNFGYHRDLTEDIATTRPRGRSDYHLLYAANGQIEVNGRTMESGAFYLYLPDEPQSYIYKKQAGSLYYWFHFTGSRAEEILRHGGIAGGFHEIRGRKTEADALLRLITDAMSHPGEQRGTYCTSLLYSFLSLLSAPQVPPSPFARARKLLENPDTPTQIGEIAALYGMTPAHFIRSFKAACGCTPAAYRIRCQMLQAKNLLADTDLPVGSIAQQCGFADPLYFSRAFKTHAGTSPTAWRSQSRLGGEGER